MLLAIAAQMLCPATPQAQTLIRTRRPKCSPLEESAQQIRYKEYSQHQNYYLDQRARSYDEDTIKNNFHRARDASFKSRLFRTQHFENTTFVGDKDLEHGMSQKRQASIEYLYLHVYNSPKPDRWKDLNMVADIMHRLAIPRGSRNSVINVLDRCMNEDNNLVDLVENRGRNSLIAYNSNEDTIILNAVMRQLSITGIFSIINEWRTETN